MDKILKNLDPGPSYIQLANDLKELLDDERFQRVFLKKYIEDFALTNIFNFSTFNKEGRQRSMENQLARSNFQIFIAEILDSGRMEEDDLRRENEAEQD